MPLSNPLPIGTQQPDRRLRVGLFLKLLASSAIVALVVGVLVTVLAGRATRQQLYFLVSSVGQRQAERIAPLLAAYYEVEGSWDGVEEIITFRPNDWPIAAAPLGRHDEGSERHGHVAHDGDPDPDR